MAERLQYKLCVIQLPSRNSTMLPPTDNRLVERMESRRLLRCVSPTFRLCQRHEGQHWVTVPSL